MYAEHHFWQVGDGCSLGQKKGGRVHAFLVDDGIGLTLIDTLYDADAAFIVEVIQHIGRELRDLRNIVITHAHRSHLGGLAALKSQIGATVWAHEWESDIIAGDRKAQAITLIPKTTFARLPFAGRPRAWAGFLTIGLVRWTSFSKTAIRLVRSRFFTRPDTRRDISRCSGRNVAPSSRGTPLQPGQSLVSAGPLSTLQIHANTTTLTLLKLNKLGADIVAVGHGEPATGEQVSEVADNDPIGTTRLGGDNLYVQLSKTFLFCDEWISRD